MKDLSLCLPLLSKRTIQICHFYESNSLDKFLSTSACDLFIHRNKNSGLTNTTKEDEKECKHI